MIDKELVKKRFSAVIGTYSEHAVAQHGIASTLASLIDEHAGKQCCRRMLEIGCGTGLLTRELLKRMQPGELYLNDICESFERFYWDLPGRPAHFVAGDAEVVGLPSDLDFIVSSSVVQWFENPVRFFQKCRCNLNEGGCIAFSTFGPNNLRELFQLTGRSLCYLSLECWKESLSGSYSWVHGEESLFQMHFPSPWDVLLHLKNTGVTGIGSRVWTKRELLDFCHDYEARFGDGNGVPLTYHPVYVIVKKR